MVMTVWEGSLPQCRWLGVGVGVLAAWAWAGRTTSAVLKRCSMSAKHIQIRKSIRLKYLARVEAFIDSPGQQEFFELVFVQASRVVF